MSTVTIVGAGNVGGAVASRLARTPNVDRIVLVDVARGLAEGTALDIAHCAALDGTGTSVVGTEDHAVGENADVLVVTAGRARRPGESRSDLTAGNAAIVRDAVRAAAARSPFAVMVVVTNPLDEMTYLASRASGFPAERVVGMAGVLDSARYRYLLARALGGAAHEVDALTLGSHGDTMVPVPSLATFRGKPVRDLLTEPTIHEIGRRTRDAGAEIVALLRRGSAFHAPGASAARMVSAIAGDSRETMPACAWVDGEYGVTGIFLGVPSVLGRRGVEGVIELPLAPDELGALREAAATIAERCRTLDAVA
jgi:malate dehydrogenase